MNRNRRTINLRGMMQSALFAALICVLSPISVPVGPVPITLGVFAVLISGIVLPWKRAAAAVAVYLLIGLAGLPVFSGGGAGPGVLLGPTGGYMWSYLPMTVLVSAFGKGKWTVYPAALLALLLCYFSGTWQFVVLMDCSWSYAMGICVYPFVVFDLLKVLLAALLGRRIKQRLQQAELL